MPEPEELLKTKEAQSREISELQKTLKIQGRELVEVQSRKVELQSEVISQLEQKLRLFEEQYKRLLSQSKAYAQNLELLMTTCRKQTEIIERQKSQIQELEEARQHSTRDSYTQTIQREEQFQKQSSSNEKAFHNSIKQIVTKASELKRRSALYYSSLKEYSVTNDQKDDEASPVLAEVRKPPDPPVLQ